MRESAGTHLDPEVVEALLASATEVDRVRARLADEPPLDARVAWR